jgi:glycosyltransferase involved in cell wall biosynthesis
MPSLRARNPGARLTIIGTGAPPFLHDHRLDGVEYVGNVAHIEPYLRSAAIVLAPVRTGGGMRMKVLQALAAGKAVVSTSRGAEGLLLDGVGAPLVVADRPQEIVETVSTLLDDPGRRRELGRGARAFVEAHHTPQAWARRLTAVYVDAIEAATQESRPGQH